MTVGIKLNRAQKAAAILVAMGKPSASKLLKFFKQDELKALIEGARHLKTIAQSDLETVVSEFEMEFAEGAGLLDSGDSIDTILTETLSAEEMSVLRGENVETVVDDGPPPVWPELEKLDPARVGAFIAGEHPQTAAVVLTKLAPGASANVLVTLDKAVRGEIIKRMMSTATIPEAAVTLIEAQIRERVLTQKASRDSAEGQIRVASLLNEMEKAQLDEIMRDLEESGAGDLSVIRSRLFSFEDIVLLTQKARVALFDGISSEMVTLALRNAPADLGEAILSSIGARSRRMIESELGQGSDGVPVADIVKARKTIASTAIRMAREGAFELPSAQAAAA